MINKKGSRGDDAEALRLATEKNLQAEHTAFSRRLQIVFLQRIGFPSVRAAILAPLVFPEARS